jgi:Ala-tRNA(Pro) deacylase
MAVAPILQEFLRHARVPYAVLPHPESSGAQHAAAVCHVRGRQWAKTVICFADGEPIQAVIPAHMDVDLPRLAVLIGASTLRLASEEELAWLYPDCEPGAVPPFGSLCRHHVFVDGSLAAEPLIVFSGGTHHDAVALRYDDFVAAVRPIVGYFALYPISWREPAECG